MNKNEPDQIDQDIKAFFDADQPPSVDSVASQRYKNKARVKANIAQRDTLLFAFVKVWAVLADMLAPLFAAFATKKAGASRSAHKINKK